MDFLRGAAIECVVLDHIFVWLGISDNWWHRWTIYSVVPLFFLAGVTFAISYCRRPPQLTWRNFLPYFWHKSKKLLGMYALGTAIILFFQLGGWNLATFCHNLITFPAQFYFIAIYLELLLVAPLLLCLWQKVRPKWRWLCLAVIFVLAWLSQKILILPAPIWLPARQLLGGWEFFVFAGGTYLGFLYAQGWRLSKLRWRWLAAVGFLSGVLIIATPLQNYIFAQPPTLATLAYGAAATLFLASVYHFCRRFYRFPLLVSLGQASLTIYIYHALVIQLLLEKTALLSISSLGGEMAILAVGASVLPILGQWLWQQFQLLGKKLFRHEFR